MKKINPGLAITCLYRKRRTMSARIDGTKFTMGGETTYGTISPDGNRIKLTDGTYWQKQGNEAPNPAADNPVPSVPQSAEIFDLNGSWTGSYENGSKARNPGVIRQTGTSVVIDKGEGSRSNGRIENNQIIATDWKLTGTISSAGKRITWANGTFWVPQNR